MSKSFAHSSKTNEWYTPSKYVDAAREAMGSIILDPASCQFANDNFVKADTYFTEHENGLEQEWFGTVFCNPPYGRGAKNKSSQELWTKKAIEEVESGRAEQVIILVNAVPDRRWFQPLFKYPICFVSPRIKFINEDGDTQASPPHGNVFVCICRKDDFTNIRVKKFEKEFSKFGQVVIPKY